MAKRTTHFLTCEIPIVFNQKTWTLHFTKYQTTPDYFSIRVITVFTTGIIISFLLFVLSINWMKMKNKSDEIFILNKELEKSNLNKDRFISVLAHDLRSPFNTLLGFTDLLNDKAEQLNQSEQKTYIKHIHNSAHSVFRLLDDLLTWARLDTGKFPFHPAKTDLSEICKNIVADYTIVALNKKIQLGTENVDTAQFVYADNMMLKTILRNLVDNAIKFSPENGLVKIRLTNTDNKIIVSVSDNGVGMTAEEKSKLFNISTIYTKTGTANEKGTGMGLILCSDLVKKHNGTIWVESTPGKGTTVSFSLPVG
jgi:signal transduction histidine kinase